MAMKRNSLEADLQPVSTRRDETKRARLSPNADEHKNVKDDAPSSRSVSATSNLDSSPSASVQTHQTSLSLAPTDDSDSEISSSDPSTDESDDDESDEETVAQDEDVAAYAREPARRVVEVSEHQPLGMHIDPERLMKEKNKLLKRLREFMPRLMKANSELAAKGEEASMEKVDEGEAHIEMDLGLGVLEEQREDGSGSGSEGDEGEEEDTAVMEKLMGGQNEHSRPGIQEVEESRVKTSDEGQ